MRASWCCSTIERSAPSPAARRVGYGAPQLGVPNRWAYFPMYCLHLFYDSTAIANEINAHGIPRSVIDVRMRA